MKISGATIGDACIPMLAKCMPNLEHLEIAKCESLGEFGVKEIISKCSKLTYIDINKIPIVNYAFLDELKQTNAELFIRRNVHQDDDFKKDNGLRVPRCIIGKKKSKKKKKKGSKKK